MKKSNYLTPIRISRLQAQGYSNLSDWELTSIAFGIRFAYQLCLAVLILAMVTKLIYLFSFLMGFAILGVILPNHPFDYLYNYRIRHWLNKPKLPARSPQLKFACSLAIVWLAAVIFLMWKDYTTTALILAGILALVAALPSVIDLCIPSVIYNAIFKNKTFLHINNQ